MQAVYLIILFQLIYVSSSSISVSISLRVAFAALAFSCLGCIPPLFRAVFFLRSLLRSFYVLCCYP